MSYGDLKQKVKSYRQQNGEPEAERPYKSYDELKGKVRQKRFQEDVRNVDQDYIKLFESAANDFFSSAQGDIGWDNAISLYQDSQKTMKDLDYKRSVITSWLASNRDSLDPGYYKSLLESMNIFSSDSRKIMSALSEAKDYYDPEKNQEAYLQYVDHQNKMGYDLGAGQKKIDDLNRAISLRKDISAIGHDVPTDLTGEYDALLREYGWSEEDDLKELLTQETVMFNQSKWTQKEAELSSVVDTPDFAKYSQMGAGMQNPSYEDANGHGYFFGWRPGADEIKNKVTFARENAELLQDELKKQHKNNDTPFVVDPIYRHVTEEEAAIYNYYLAKDGEEKAEEYLQSLQDKLNQREAGKVAEFLNGNTLAEMLYAPNVGIDQFRSGMSSLFDDSDYIAPSAIQYAGQAIREDLADNGPKIFGSSLGQIGYDALSTTANMAPSILTSMAVGMVSKTAGAAVGNALMGASAAGNAYADKLNAGYSKEQARTYGLMVGASEIAMEKLLGGITALGGGTLSKMAIKGLDKVDNVLARVAKSAGGKILMNAGSEALEEGLQSILEPYIWQAVSGEEANVDWEEALYSSLLGFVTGGLFEAGNVSAERAARDAQALETYGPEQGALVAEGLELDPDSKFAQRMQSRLDRGKDLTGGQLYKLGHHNEAAMVKNDISTIQKAAESALTNYGETGDVKAISEALAKQAAGKKLSKAERTAISESKYGQRVANELNPENIQSGDFNTAWAESIGTERINAEEYGRLIADAEASPVSAESVTVAPEGSATANLTGVDSMISEEVSDSTVEAGTSVSLEEASQKYGAQAKAMVATYDPGQDVASFDRAYGVAYEMGKSGVSMDYAVNSSATSYLTQAQRELAYRQGTFAATNKTKSVDTMFKGKATTEGGRRKGAVKLEGIKASEFRKMLKDSNDPRGKAAKALMTIAEVTGVDIVLFKSQVDASGRYVGEQGRFEWKNDTIYIDVNAGLSYGSDAGELTKYAMLRTFGHEFTHFLEKNAATQYSEFRKLVFAEMSKAGTNVDYLIQRKQAQYKEQGLSYEAASREVVAESMGDILRDSNFVETLAQKHNSLFKTLLDQFKRFIRNIRSYFNSLAANTSPEAKALKEEINGTLKYMDSIVEAFDKMAVEAVENYQARMAESDGIVAELTPGQEGVVVGKDGEPVAYSTEDGTVMLSIRTYEEEGRSAFRAYLEKCVTSKKLTKTEMTEMLDGIEEIYTVCKEFKDKYAPFSAWSDAEVIRDTKGKPVFSVVTPNGEYKMNLDFSLVCKKRRALDAVLNEMSKRGIIDDFELGKKTIVKINELIRKHGFETACALCFVDAKRFRQADVADSMVKLYNDLVKSLVPEGSVDQIEHFNFAGVRTKTSVENGIHTWANSELDFTHINEVLEQYGKDTVEAKAAKYIKNNPKGRRLLQRGDFMSSGGFDAVKSQNQDIMSLYNSKKGTGGPKAAFGDVQYLNEVISKARWWTPKKAYEVGGVRVQSFSDYVPRMVFDYVQMIYDLAATKLPAHAYTKEALFVKQFGKTGIKINMSLIPAVVEDGIAPGLDANGDYVWAGESFDYDTAVEIQSKPGYTENCGTICVGVSYEHILKLLRDPNIRMVIPYHKSGLNPVVAHMNKVDKFVDYTSLKSNPRGCQNTMDAEGKKVEKDFNFNETLRKSGDPRAAADAYLKWCDDHGYTPKFAEFRKEANYYKLLIDFTVYDESGNYVPQREVRAVFPKEGDAFGSMKDLIKEGLEEDAVVQGTRDMKIPKIVDEIERSIPRSEAEISDTERVEQAQRDLEADYAKHFDFEELFGIKNKSPEMVAEALEYSDATTQFSLREEAPPKRTIKAYKVFRVADGKLYPPKIANLTDDESLNVPLSRDPRKGKSRVTATGNDTPVGVWINADVGGIAVDENGEAMLNTNGRIKVYDLNGMKGNGSFDQKTTLAFRPGWHLGSIPEAIQFLLGDGTMPDDLVYAECEIAADIDYQAAAMSYGVRPSGKFVHADAGLPAVPVDGFYKYKTNPKTDTHPWYITGAIKVTRIIGDAERREICAKEGITIAPRYGGKDIEPTDIWASGQPAVAKDLTPYKKGQKNRDNEQLLAMTLEKIKALSATNPKLGYVQRDLDFNSQGIIDEIEKAKLDVDALRSAYEKHGFNPYYFDTDEEVQYQARTYDTVEEMDGDYLAAVESGDMETAQRMVDEAAKRAGYTVKVYHGTPNTRTEINPKWKDSVIEIHKLLLPNEPQLKEGTTRFYNFANLLEYRIRSIRPEIRNKIPKNLLRIVQQGPARNFTVFEEKYLGSSTKTNDARDGIFATPDKYFASRFTSTYSYDPILGITEKTSIGDGAIYELYLRPDETTEFRKTTYGPKNSRVAEVVVKNAWQLKSADPVTYDDNGNVIPLSKRFNEENPDIRYQLRTNTLTDHEILDMAAKELDTSKLTEGEKAALDIFRKKVTTLKALKEERQKQGSLYHEAQFGENRDKAKASAARNRMSVLDSQITRASAEVLSLEDKKVLKDVLRKSRKVIEQHERKSSLDAIRAAREDTRARERRRADERVEALRQKKNERIAEVRAEERQSAKDKLDKLRSEKNERIAEVRAEEREKASERVQNVRESYKSSILREKIRAFKSKLERNLLNPTERQYVPAGLTQAMIDVVNLIDIDTDLINEDGTVNKAQERRDITKAKLDALLKAYTDLNAKDSAYSGEFDGYILEYISELSDKFAGRHLSEMTFDELTEMYEILRSIEETLQDARKLIGWGSAETVYEAGEAIIAEQANITAKRKNGKRTAAQETRDNSLALTLSPVRFVERMVGYNQDSYFLKMFRAFEKGVRKKNLFTMRAYKEFETLTSRKQFEDAVYNPIGNIYTDAKGRSFRLSKMQMMQAIMSIEREQANNMNHIARGGFSFADLDMLRKGKLKEAISAEHSHRVANAVDMVGEFIDLLKNDKWAHDYMAAARKFFNETAKDAVNETSLILKHRIIAKDKSYIPFEVDGNFIVKEISAADNIQQTISSYGMLKDTKQLASQPLIITGLNNVLDRHIEQVGNVYGLAIEIRNFNKVWNVKGLEEGDKAPTVQEVIEGNWGKKGKALVEQAVQDIQGPRINNQSDLYRKVKSGYIGATFLLNLSVVTKQIGSMYSATSMLKWRGPVRQIGNLLYTMTHSKKLSAEVDKYTATAWMRRQGMSDAEIYTMMTEGKRSWLGRFTAKWPAALNPTKWITAMDHAVALSLWKYAKEDTAKRTGLKGEALLEATAEFYDQVIENTQSMTDMLHRPEIQKRNDVISESFGMFKTDLYQTAGQLLNTWERNQALHTKETKQALGRTLYSVTMSVVWAQLMTSVFALLRYKVNQYRDDEDEDLTMDSWLKRQSFSIMGDIAGYILPLLGSEIVGAVENAVYGESGNLVDSIGLTAINNAYDAIIKVCGPLAKGELPETSEMRKVTGNVLQMFGVPVNNILRSIDAIALHAKDIANGRFFSFEAGVQRSASHHAHRIMEAVAKGNMELAQDLYAEAVEGSALKKSEDGSLSEDALKDARSSLKTAMGKKFKEGTMSREVAEKILTELFGISKDDVYWTIRGWETGGDSRYSAVFDAALSGKGFNQAVKEMTDHGYDKDNVLKELKDQIHTWYTDEESEVRISKQQATNMLTKYIGMKPDEVTSTINQWACKVVTGIAYGDIKGEFLAGRITASRAIDMRVRYGGKSREDATVEVTAWEAVKKYGLSLEDAEGYTKRIEELGQSLEQVGIRHDIYLRYKDLKSECKGVDANGDGKPDSGTKKAEIMEAIHSLPISVAQKDALYYSNGWSKNTIHEAPWH